jgi:polyphosphate kinase
MKAREEIFMHITKNYRGEKESVLVETWHRKRREIKQKIEYEQEHPQTKIDSNINLKISKL